jgi:hypothetical protein
VVLDQARQSRRPLRSQVEGDLASHYAKRIATTLEDIVTLGGENN